MCRRRTWITAVTYGLGVLVLAASVAMAMYIPQWYGTWQDSQMMGEVQMSKRENIEFIDTASLDNAGRLQLISQAEEVMLESYDGYSSRILRDPGKYMETCRKQAELFAENGLIPEFYVEFVSEEFSEMISSPIVILDNNQILQVNFAMFCNWEKQDERLILITDAETDFVYYISFSGIEGIEEADRRFGEEFWKITYYTPEPDEELLLEVKPEILEGWNIQAVCGAESVNMHPTANYGYIEMDLIYENVQAKGYHYMISGNAAGFALAFGMEDWNRLAEQELQRIGLAGDMIIMKNEQAATDENIWEYEDVYIKNEVMKK